MSSRSAQGDFRLMTQGKSRDLPDLSIPGRSRAALAGAVSRNALGARAGRARRTSSAVTAWYHQAAIDDAKPGRDH